MSYTHSTVKIYRLHLFERQGERKLEASTNKQENRKLSRFYYNSCLFSSKLSTKEKMREQERLKETLSETIFLLLFQENLVALHFLTVSPLSELPT